MSSFMCCLGINVFSLIAWDGLISNVSLILENLVECNSLNGGVCVCVCEWRKLNWKQHQMNPDSFALIQPLDTIWQIFAGFQCRKNINIYQSRALIMLSIQILSWWMHFIQIQPTPASTWRHFSWRWDVKR